MKPRPHVSSDQWRAGVCVCVRGSTGHRAADPAGQGCLQAYEDAASPQHPRLRGWTRGVYVCGPTVTVPSAHTVNICNVLFCLAVITYLVVSRLHLLFSACLRSDRGECE